MKNTIVIAFFALGLMTSCKKSDGGNKGIISESHTTETKVTDNNGKIDSSTLSSSTRIVNGKKVQEVSIPYKASDGSRAKATYVTIDNLSTIIIEANNKKFELDKKSNTAAGAIYERNGITAEKKGDSLFITQDNNVIHLGEYK